MKLQLLLSILFTSQLLFAQSFTEKAGVPFTPVSDGAIAFADIDGDNDEDVLITGSTKAILYTNDGLGNFTEVTGSSLIGVSNSAAAFADIDGDSDQDLFISGNANSIGFSSKLYVNDGTGNFTEMTATPFEDVENGTVDFVDVDGDNDQDLFISGFIGGNYTNRITRLYKNDGSGNFTEQFLNNFYGINWGDIDFADIDGDNDLDLLLTGAAGGSSVKFLYRNDGTGDFSSVSSSGLFGPMRHCSIVFCDVDGDNDQDVIASGQGGFVLPTSVLFLNDGTGIFTEKTTSFEDVEYSSVAVSDIDNDNDMDVYITGKNSSGVPSAKLFANDGMGNFTELTGLPFLGVEKGSIAFSDVDGDNDEDLLITGSNSNDIAKLYINNGVTPNDNSTSNDIQFDFLVFPNPSESNKIHLSFKSEEYGDLKIRIYDLNGRLLKNQTEIVEEGEQVITIDLRLISNGDYLIEIGNDKRKGVQLFSIQ